MVVLLASVERLVVGMYFSIVHIIKCMYMCVYISVMSFCIKIPPSPSLQPSLGFFTCEVVLVT